MRLCHGAYNLAACITGLTTWPEQLSPHLNAVTAGHPKLELARICGLIHTSLACQMGVQRSTISVPPGDQNEGLRSPYCGIRFEIPTKQRRFSPPEVPLRFPTGH